MQTLVRRACRMIGPALVGLLILSIAAPAAGVPSRIKDIADFERDQGGRRAAGRDRGDVMGPAADIVPRGPGKIDRRAGGSGVADAILQDNLKTQEVA